MRAGGYEVCNVETLVRGTLGRLLFSGDEAKKPVNVISGGEQGRMLFGKLMLLRNNVLLMDEPTNHLDMESIESLNTALEKYNGTLIFVSHDREFVSSLATRIVDIKPDRTIVDYRGSYEEYLASQGFEGNLLTSDHERFVRNQSVLAAAPKLAVGPPTIGWVSAALAAMAEIVARLVLVDAPLGKGSSN